jgi:hypothetical protein
MMTAAPEEWTDIFHLVSAVVTLSKTAQAEDSSE